MTDNVKKAIKYAKDVIAGKIPACRFIVKNCQQFIDDLEKQSDLHPKTWTPNLRCRLCPTLINFV